MPNLTTEKETQILAALQAKVQSVASADNVLIENPLIDSKQDVVEKLTVESSDGKTEVKYIYISFLSFEDSATEGCDDEPLVHLTYNFHIFQQFNEKREDNSFSEQDFKSLIFNLRNRFLQLNRVLTSDCEHTPLRQSETIILDDDPLTGVFGHIVDITCKVEVS